MQIHSLKLFALILIGYGCGQDVLSMADVRMADGEKKLSDKLRLIVDHYKHADPVGIPGLDIPDPYPVPDTNQTVSIATLYCKNTTVHGIRKFRILYINADIGAMEVHAAMVIDKLLARGKYTMSTFWQRTMGPFTVDITGLKITARANLGVERDGKLRAQDINIDLGFNTININFENLGFFGSMLQGVINSVGNIFFDSIKPYVLKEAYTKVRAEINNKLDEVAGDMQFPNSISPLDMVIADLRKIVRQKHWDPFKVKDFNETISMSNSISSSISVVVALSGTTLTGLSSFQRVGNITVKIKNNTAVADFEIGCQKLVGVAKWTISIFNGLISWPGTASFSVDYVSARIILAQPLDTRKTPELKDLDLDVGNIQVRLNGVGTLDYVIEFAVNVLHNLLRYQIVDGLEVELKEKIQKILNTTNSEDIVIQVLHYVDKMQKSGFNVGQGLEKVQQNLYKFDIQKIEITNDTVRLIMEEVLGDTEMNSEELPKVDEIKTTGFKLSAIKGNEEPYDEDDFFNF